MKVEWSKKAAKFPIKSVKDMKPGKLYVDDGEGDSVYLCTCVAGKNYAIELADGDLDEAGQSYDTLDLSDYAFREVEAHLVVSKF